MLRLTRAQVREVDRISIEKYHVPGIVLMENAARAVADVVLAEVAGKRAARVVIFCGGGNNGGDGLAAARHLHNAALDVLIVFCTDPERYRGDALVNCQIVDAMNLPRARFGPEFDLMKQRPDVVVDAVFGTGLEQPPRTPIDDLVTQVFVQRHICSKPVIAVDLPSGLDCDSGSTLGKTI